ncbi:MAG: DUF4381 domain-containing protein [Chromatiales bacterium]|jgi:hypothetical protein
MPATGAQIRDIHGLDAISWWPPGPGWWLIAAAVFLATAGIWLLLRYNRERPILAPKWQRDARRRLRSLRKRQAHMSTKEIAGELSELMRRIAMARFGRRVCAGLSGEEWLDWLARNDPAGFDWAARAHLMLELPYAPPGRAATERALFNLLIDAALAWVASTEQPAAGERSRA